RVDRESPRRARPRPARGRRRHDGLGLGGAAPEGGRLRARPLHASRHGDGAVRLSPALTTDALVALARARLAAHTRRVVPPGPLVAAAVLVPIVDRAGAPSMLFTKRTDRVGHHKG